MLNNGFFLKLLDFALKIITLFSERALVSEGTNQFYGLGCAFASVLFL